MNEEKEQESKDGQQNGQPKREATIMELATLIASSRDFPECRSPERAAVRILAGREIGVGPIASVIGIRIQSGRVSMDAGLMAGLIKRSDRYDYRVSSHDEKGCVLEFFDSGQSVGFSSFTWEDAKKAGLDKKDTWRAYPRNLLYARALSNGARWFCPGIFGGAVYSHEELGYQVDDEGRAIESGDAGSDLCTREQRQKITATVEAAGKKLADVLADLGVRMLDELSGYEADKLIKKLEKQAARKAAEPTPEPSKEGTAPAIETPLTPSQQMLADAFHGVQPGEMCSDQQRERILMLAEALEPDENELPAMMEAILAKRGVKKISELTATQAASLIALMEEHLGPPFNPGQQVTVQATAR